ncbi:hypothetical protein [Photobacterium iliopiscarium]|uniref:hypothetical protein n=1 Tax=Photobacterium iliopiscarium TaxID=56192 RepID=UPI001E3E2938|nr:hypothetical protein [Photobacterium iliopiscarium]MCD9468846.1 hypothetical protein [Photobacterium iliopiscarium]
MKVKTYDSLKYTVDVTTSEEETLVTVKNDMIDLELIITVKNYNQPQPLRNNNDKSNNEKPFKKYFSAFTYYQAALGAVFGFLLSENTMAWLVHFLNVVS